MSTYGLGTVAWISVDGVGSYKAIRIVGERGPVWAHSADEDGQVLAHDDRVSDIRPLVVLDVDDPINAAQVLHKAARRLPLIDDVALVGAIAAQIEAATKPPRIPEPGLWGVVDASTADNAERRQFGRVPESDEQHWLETDAMGWYLWSDLIDPTIVRPGIEDES